MIGEWQPRFYVATGISSGLVAIMNYMIFPTNFTGGFTVGFGVAGMIASFILAIQSYEILSQWERLELGGL